MAALWHMYSFNQPDNIHISLPALSSAMLLSSAKCKSAHWLKWWLKTQIHSVQDPLCLAKDEAPYSQLLFKTKWGERGDTSSGRTIKSPELNWFSPRHLLQSFCAECGFHRCRKWDQLNCYCGSVMSFGDMTPTRIHNPKSCNGSLCYVAVTPPHNPVWFHRYTTAICVSRPLQATKNV